MTASPTTLHSPLSTLSAANGGRRRSAAFTLVETALAMLAIGLGLLAFLGLSRLGLQSNQETLTDQRCAALSNTIFETLREYNARFIEEARTNSIPWQYLWEDVYQRGSTAIPFPPVAGISEDPDLAPLHFWTSQEITQLNNNQKLPSPAYVPDRISLADWNPGYVLRMSGDDSSHIAGDINAIQFALTIFPDGNILSSDRTYTIWLTNSGGLP